MYSEKPFVINCINNFIVCKIIRLKKNRYRNYRGQAFDNYITRIVDFKMCHFNRFDQYTTIKVEVMVVDLCFRLRFLKYPQK